MPSSVQEAKFSLVCTEYFSLLDVSKLRAFVSRAKLQMRATRLLTVGIGAECDAAQIACVAFKFL